MQFQALKEEEKKQKTPEYYSRLSTIVMAAMLIFVAAVVWETHSQMTHIESGWKDYKTLTAKKDYISSRLYRQIGYDGMIHHFKNYVLRGDPVYRKAFKNDVAITHSLLQEIRLLDDIDANEEQALQKVEQVVDLYMEKLPLVTAGHAQGLQVSEIDRQVKVDDKPAIEALEVMREQIIDSEQLIFEKMREVQRAITWINISMLLIIPFLLFIVYIKRRILYHLVQHTRRKISAERHLKAILDSTPEGMITINKDGVIEEFNAACEDMFGWSKEEAKGQNISMLMTGQHKIHHDRYIQNYLEGGRAKLIGQPREFTAVRKDGETIPIKVSLAEFFDDERQYFTGVIHDLEQQKALENELEGQRVQALHASKMSTLGELAAGVAHEVNNPLTLITTQAEVMKTRLDDKEDMLARLEKIQKSTDRIAQIITGLKKFSRGAGSGTTAKVNICDIINESADITVSKLERHHVQLTIDCESRSVIDCNQIEIEQVLVNLIVNAVDVLKKQDDRRILLTAHDVGQEVEIAVEDNGPGVPPDQRERLFEPFFTSKPVGEGTGLGLSISHGIIKEHKGRIFYDDSAGCGRFVIRLPMAPP